MKHDENILQYLEPEIKAALYKEYLEYLENVLDDEFISFKTFAVINLHKYD